MRISFAPKSYRFVLCICEILDWTPNRVTSLQRQSWGRGSAAHKLPRQELIPNFQLMSLIVRSSLNRLFSSSRLPLVLHSGLVISHSLQNLPMHGCKFRALRSPGLTVRCITSCCPVWGAVRHSQGRKALHVFTFLQPCRQFIQHKPFTLLQQYAEMRRLQLR